MWVFIVATLKNLSKKTSLHYEKICHVFLVILAS